MTKEDNTHLTVVNNPELNLQFSVCEQRLFVHIIHINCKVYCVF